MYTSQSPFTFSLIAPYGNMTTLLSKYTTDLPCKLFIHNDAVLDEASNIALNEIATKDIDVILSRGGTAEYIRKRVDIPVISIPTTALDLLRTLHPFVGMVKKIAFFNYQQFLPEVKLVSKTLNISIIEYIFHSQEDLASRIVEAKAQGAELNFGGILLGRMRNITGVEGILVESGEAAIQMAVDEAFSMSTALRKEQKRQARMRTILDSVTEGVFATDENNQITLINPAAEKLLSVTSEQVLGADAQEYVPNSRTAEVLKSGKAERQHVQKIGKTTIITNRIPIISQKKTLGVVCTFSEATQIQRAEQHLRDTLRPKAFTARYTFADIITQNPTLTELKELATNYAQTDATILLQGESGTGKELFAQGIHRASKRQHGPFIPVNCAAIPESLLESEFFGYEEGAFTGARRQGKAGFFEMAHHGTLFLDEVSELPLSMQTRLLRVLQEREVLRISGNAVIPIDVRIICATNRDLEAWTFMGNFRQDLFYRLNVLPIHIPPLRKRLEDIEPLIHYFIQEKLLSKVPFPNKTALKKICTAFVQHTWPGNVRELYNVIERLAIVAAINPHIEINMLLRRIWTLPKYNETSTNHIEDIPHVAQNEQNLKMLTAIFEKNTIEKLLQQNNYNHAKVAKLLNISRMSLWRKLGKKNTS